MVMLRGRVEEAPVGVPEEEDDPVGELSCVLPIADLSGRGLDIEAGEPERGVILEEAAGAVDPFPGRAEQHTMRLVILEEPVHRRPRPLSPFGALEDRPGLGERTGEERRPRGDDLVVEMRLTATIELLIKSF